MVSNSLYFSALSEISNNLSNDNLILELYYKDNLALISRADKLIYKKALVRLKCNIDSLSQLSSLYRYSTRESYKTSLLDILNKLLNYFSHSGLRLDNTRKKSISDVQIPDIVASACLKLIINTIRLNRPYIKFLEMNTIIMHDNAVLYIHNRKEINADINKTAVFKYISGVLKQFDSEIKIVCSNYSNKICFKFKLANQTELVYNKIDE